jgi:hypothetical protein
VIARRLQGNLAAAADRGPKDFPDLLLTPGVGARTVRALAMVAEVGSRTRRYFLSRMAERIGIHFRCRSRSMTRPSAY